MYSDSYSITLGTTQGSCLGPLLFILFCNDIHLLPIYGKLILFADDTMLINHHENKNFLAYMMSHGFSILSDWFKANQLSLSITKTNSMLFWPKGRSLEIEMDGLIIQQVHQTTFLGVILDDELCYTPHINHISANKHLMQLDRNFLNFDSLLSVHYTHIYNHLTYSLLTWGSMLS